MCACYRCAAACLPVCCLPPGDPPRWGGALRWLECGAHNAWQVRLSAVCRKRCVCLPLHCHCRCAEAVCVPCVTFVTHVVPPCRASRLCGLYMRVRGAHSDVVEVPSKFAAALRLVRPPVDARVTVAAAAVWVLLWRYHTGTVLLNVGACFTWPCASRPTLVVVLVSVRLPGRACPSPPCTTHQLRHVWTCNPLRRVRDGCRPLPL